MPANRFSNARVPTLALALALLTAGSRSLAAEVPESAPPGEKAKVLEENVTQGGLRAVGKEGGLVECPLRHTDVEADVSGFIARVKVTQTFYNPSDERIEAVYVFPLPHEAAVDDMTMVVGDRKIVGVIKRRAEARQVYEEALAAGQTAALLEQERPNIFTQSVGNIDPGQDVRIEIRYVDVLNYDKGTYEFHFPMVVGPRFHPGAPLKRPQPTPPELQGKVSPPVPDTTRVPDASRISPPVLAPGFRNGHDISLSLRLDAGVPVRDLKVVNHKAKIERDGNRRAEIAISPEDSIPNKDFVLRYYVLGKKPEMAVLSHTGDPADARRLGHGYFMFMVQPQEDERLSKSPPREIVFLLDVSGSMRGQPTEKVKEAMREMLQLCRDVDTLQVITFAGQTNQLFEKPLPVNRENIAKAVNFTEGVRGAGGTHMLEGIKRAIDQPIDAERVRIVIMLSDGYIGNEAEIIEHVGKSCGDQIRFWAIGIGNSPNMFLIDGAARQGGGMGKRLALNETAAGLAEEVISRIQRAQLAKIQIDWGGLEVAETYPAKIPELWAGRPVILFGRYAGGGAAEITLGGVVEGEPVRWPLQVRLPENQPEHEVLAKVWARKKIEDLMQQTYYAGSPAVEEEVTAIALDYRLMSQYTSFVAVDAENAEKLGRERPAQPPRQMLVPVPLPEGTQWEGFFGPRGEMPGMALDLAYTAVFDEAEAKATNGLTRRGRLNREAARGISGMSAMGAMPAMGGGLGGGGMSMGMPMSQPMAAGAMPALSERSERLAAAAPMSPSAGRLLQRQAGQRRSLGLAPAAGKSAKPGRAAYFGPAAGEPVVALEALTDAMSVAGGYDASAVGAQHYTAGALSSDSQALGQSAEKFLDAGRKLREGKKPSEARAELLRAYFLATAAANLGQFQAATVASAALAELESLHSDRVSAWQEDLPALGKRVDLVLRDLSISEAISAIEQAAGIKIRLIPGSVDDAAAMLVGHSARVTWLDLRGATVAQALDWLLQPVRLAWRKSTDGREIVVGSDRRLPHLSAWVYDASTIALPSTEEFGEVKDGAKAVSQAKQCAGQFLDALRKAAGIAAEEAVWFAPGHLLVFGTPEIHDRVAGALAQLADPQAKPTGALAALHEKTSRRAAQRRESLEKLDEVHRLRHVAAAHDEYAWKLLAAALGDELDLEALTHLQIAWKKNETKTLLAGRGAALTLRSAWAITSASRMLAEEGELTAFAETVRAQCRPAAEQAAAALEKMPQDVATVLAAAYGALAIDNAKLKSRVHGALAAEPAGLVVAIGGLLENPDRIDREQLHMLITKGDVAGEDGIVLTALACRRAGGDLWSAFRAQRQDLLSRQPLPGSAVVLVNRLSGRMPEVVASRQ